ncbi:StlD/DarB family beta-ketosynthase [Parashewanella spongiae]|uniref:StlD/DarB family beta-ketosynthase n=1 Tax=Parashewanella spongiae TaxID=342950 RepID=A0A3A6TCD2_9GAMM|nr:beta-ketoacyl-ACP synthase III [Parashewanella spongiae]MCL1079374.1 beta-ketoacyl-ACP synthase III [Parashewanella spongiae]RJY07517.1 StlD/DarB family beta-ketosynthase [Parashewanella spongiae]
MDVYINSTGHYLPGDAVGNESIEDILGLIHGKKSRLKNKILKSNGIVQRHYAINEQQETKISNSDMAATAGIDCINNSYLSPAKIQMLSCATSQGDMILPGFGSMVQAALNLSEIELHTSHGICSSSMMALKVAVNNIKCEDSDNALVVASELTSRLFKHSRYEQLDSNEVDFNAEFLRWMLSDGAGAILLENRPRAMATSIKIDWITSFSHANVLPVCMSVGRAKNEEDKTWQDYQSYADAEKAGALMLRQDVRLLEHIVAIGVQGFLKLIAQGKIIPSKIDHVLCHFSSKYFKSKIFDMLDTASISIPESKWYTNLYQRGNTGCAAIFIMLDEFIKTHDLKAGETIFCMVPESGRFNCAYMHLTVAG